MLTREQGGLSHVLGLSAVVFALLFLYSSLLCYVANVF